MTRSRSFKPQGGGDLEGLGVERDGVFFCGDGAVDGDGLGAADVVVAFGLEALELEDVEVALRHEGDDFIVDGHGPVGGGGWFLGRGGRWRRRR